MKKIKLELTLWYIGVRINPQLGTYYKALGELKILEVNKRELEGCIYGSYEFLPFATEDEYLKAIDSMKAEGKSFTYVKS